MKGSEAGRNAARRALWVKMALKCAYTATKMIAVTAAPAE
jgi:hypothetical protein